MIVLSAGEAPATGALGIVVSVALVMGLSLAVPWAMPGKRHLPRWAGALLAGHTEFLILGLILGPAALGWFGADLQGQMRPLLTVALGWVGLLFGLQWDWLKVKRFPRAHFGLSAGQALMTFAVVTVVMAVALLALRRLGPLAETAPDWRLTMMLAMLLGAIACVTAPIGVGWLVAVGRARGRNTQLVQFMAATDGVVGLLLFGALLCALRPTSPVEVPGLRALANLGLTAGLGLALGWLAHFTLRGRWNAPDYLLWLMGLVVLSSGTAHAVGQSPLVVNFLMGAVFVNLSHQSERVVKSLGGAEVPFYIVFLILGGATLALEPGWEWLLIVPYVLARLVGKVLGVAVLAPSLPMDFSPRRDLGFAMLSQGGLALAMTIDIGLLLPGKAPVTALLTLVIVSIVINQMVAPSLAEGPLRRAGEIGATT